MTSHLIYVIYVTTQVQDNTKTKKTEHLFNTKKHMVYAPPICSLGVRYGRPGFIILFRFTDLRSGTAFDPDKLFDLPHLEKIAGCVALLLDVHPDVTREDKEDRP
jgi:hypothetical protein